VERRRRLRLVAPEMDRATYEGRTVDGVVLTELITFEDYSEADVRALQERLRLGERETIVLAMAQRMKALATEDLTLRWASTMADVRVIDAAEFRQLYLQGDQR
jgi:predicted nucleic acid-binding protein